MGDRSRHGPHNSPRYQREPGRFAVRTVGASAAQITTMGGTRITPDVALGDLSLADSALLILPGAEAWEEDGGLAEFAAKAREFIAAGAPLAAICGATMGLAKAGLLDDRDHTGAAREYLAMSGYAGGDRYVDADAVNDDGLITAGPAHGIAFAREIFAELELYTPEKLTAWEELYSTGDPGAFEVLAA